MTNADQPALTKPKWKFEVGQQVEITICDIDYVMIVKGHYSQEKQSGEEWKNKYYLGFCKKDGTINRAKSGIFMLEERLRQLETPKNHE